MNESQIFTDALKLATAAERSAYLDAACAGDPGLRDAVECLLRAHDSDPGFLEQPADALGGTAESSTASTILAPSESSSLVIAGRYKLLEPIGARRGWEPSTGPGNRSP